jgi:twitching motility protein PilU
MNISDNQIDLSQIMQQFVAKQASDLYLTYGFPPTVRIDGILQKLSETPLDDATIAAFSEELINEEQMDNFHSTLELNLIKVIDDIRLRINMFRQLQHDGFVIRRVETNIPTVDELGLPSSFKDLIMAKRGLVLVVGQTGSGKSTSLAAMIGHRNQHGNGHIVTIEDPIEFVHQHQNCIISQRDVGIDTYSYGMALKNALRQTPDVILIGEIRDRETMEHAISFAETGHLCVSTLHANNANGAIERILNFFPIEAHRQILINLSFNLRGIISQRLVEKKTSSKEKNRSGRVPAVEVLLNEGIIRDYLYRGEIGKIKEIMEKNVDAGMQTFDQALIKLYHTGLITMEAAIAEADSPSNVRMEINQQTMQAKFSVEPNFSTQHRNDF